MSSHDIFHSGVINFNIFYSVVMTMTNEQCLTDYAESVLFFSRSRHEIKRVLNEILFPIAEIVSLLCSGLNNGVLCTHFS